MTDHLHEAALLALCFAPTTASLPQREQAHACLAQRWARYTQLGMDQPVTGDLPMGFPDAAPRGGDGRFRVLAARRRPPEQGGVFYAYVFTEHDILGLAAMLAPNLRPSPLDAWQRLRAEWAPPDPPAPDQAGLLGEALVFQALADTDDRDRLEQIAGGAWPTTARDDGWATALTTADRLTLWEPDSHCGAATVRRELCVVAPEHASAALERLTWTGRPLRLPPLARYLLHAAKLGYQWRVYQRDARIAEVRAATEPAIERLLDLHEQARQRPLPTDRLRAAQEELHALQARGSGLLVAGTQLRELHQTVATARHNMTRATPQPHHDSDEQPRGGAGSLFDRDQHLAEELTGSIEADVVYLEALRERAREVQALTSSRVQAAVEHDQDRRVQLQTSILGALLAALAAMGTLQVTLPLHGEAQWLLVVLVTLLAFAFPGVILRHHEPGPRPPLYRRPIPVALCLAAGVGTALAVVLPWRLVTDQPSPWWIPTAAALTAVGAAAAGFTRSDRRPPDPPDTSKHARNL